jgi:hypothetical protein
VGGGSISCLKDRGRETAPHGPLATCPRPTRPRPAPSALPPAQGVTPLTRARRWRRAPGRGRRSVGQEGRYACQPPFYCVLLWVIVGYCGGSSGPMPPAIRRAPPLHARFRQGKLGVRITRSGRLGRGVGSTAGLWVRWSTINHNKITITDNAVTMSQQ